MLTEPFSKNSIEPLRASDASEGANLLSIAFIDSPLTLALFREPDSASRGRLAGLYRFFLEEMPGKAVCMKRGGKLVALMHIIEPGECKTPRWRMLELMPRLLAVSGPRLPRLLRWLSFLGEHDPPDQHWHLGWVAVEPELQGKGIGSLLLDYFCELVDKDNYNAYVVTTKERNVSLYEKYGFSTNNRASIFRVPHWFMKRPPSHD